MAATYQGSMKLLEPIEGGYAYAYDNAGETYRGIDRKYNPKWPGWAILDAYKKKYGAPKQGAFLIDPSLNAAVNDFYSKLWLQAGMNNFNNPTLAAMAWALIVHRASNGVNQINLHAKQYGATKFFKNSVSPEAANAIERNLPGSYATFRSRLVSYYNSFADKKKQSYINNRVLVFPPTLTGAAAPTGLNTLVTTDLQKAGIFLSILKLFF